MAPKRRKMVNFEIGEISAVDVPAQAGALRSLIKNDSTPADPIEESSAMTDVAELSTKMAKRYIDPSEGVVSFATVLAEEYKEQAFWEQVKSVSPSIEALECSLRSIAGTSDVDQGTKMTMMRNMVEDFMTVIRSQWSGADTYMMSALGKSTEEEENDMAAKTVEDLQKEVTALTKKLTEAEATATKSAAEGAKALEAKVAELEKSLGDLTAERDELAVKAAMSPEERTYMQSMGADGRKAFMGMTPAERKKAMKKSAEDDEILTVKGVSIRKSANPEMFEFLKAQQEENVALAKSAADERELREMSEFTKRAETEFEHLPGTPIAKAKALKMLNDLPNEELSAITKMLEAGEKAIKGAFTFTGHRGGRGDPIVKNGNADGAAFMKRVSDIQKTEGLKQTEAMSKARKLHPEEFEAYRNGGDS